MRDKALDGSDAAFKKAPPPNYTESERRSIVQLYDLFDCKATSMRMIHSIDGYETIPERKVKRWKTGMVGAPRVPGKPISEEFEHEVMEECKKTDNKSFKKSAATNGYTYSLVKLCANELLNKNYWDKDSSSFVQKWRLDKRTCSLLFTNKWVSGVLRRWKAYSLSKAAKRSAGPSVAEQVPVGTRREAVPEEGGTVDEFEAEVLAECVRAGLTATFVGSVSSSVAFSMVAQSAHKVLHAEYWDDRSASHIKKWLLEERTSRMQFTADWIAGILRRAVQHQVNNPSYVAEGDSDQTTLTQSELSRYFDIDEDSLDGHYCMLIGLISG